MMSLFKRAIAPVIFAGALSPAAYAQDATISAGDTAWILTATALVLFMSLPGLALFYGGLVRAKNYLSVLMKIYAIAALASIVWIVAGYSIAFGSGNGWWGGLDNLFLGGLERGAVSGTIPESLFLAFQMTFAIITPGLIVGAFVERVKFLPVLIFTVLWLLFVYAPVCHWIWGGGWLANLNGGVVDFAGGLVVHATAGISALVYVLLLGKRKGFPEDLAVVNLIRVRLKIDDSLDVFAVHGVGGILGILLLPFLSSTALGGTGEGELMTQLIGTGAVIAWSAIGSFIILMGLKMTLGLRVSEEQEYEGLDVSLHGESAYN